MTVEPPVYFSIVFSLESNESNLTGNCKKKRKRIQIFDENHGITPLEKCNFFAFLSRCFESLKRLFFFLSKISSNTFIWLILPKFKKWKKFNILSKIMDLFLFKNFYLILLVNSPLQWKELFTKSKLCFALHGLHLSPAAVVSQLTVALNKKGSGRFW